MFCNLKYRLGWQVDKSTKRNIDKGMNDGSKVDKMGRYMYALC